MTWQLANCWARADASCTAGPAGRRCCARWASRCRCNGVLHAAQGYPRSGLAAAATTAFHAGVAAVLGLYALFWLRLRLTDTLPVLAMLVIVTGAAGYMALTARAAARRKLA